MIVALGCKCKNSLTNGTRVPKFANVDGVGMKGCNDGSAVCGAGCKNMLFYFNCDKCRISYKTYMCMF